MADYYTKFSFILELPKEAREYALNIDNIASQREEITKDFPPTLIDHLEDWQFETEEDEKGLWLHSENGGIDSVCAFVQHLMQQFVIPGAISFEWSSDCSKPRVDAYGGGAAIVTAEDIKTMSTGGWLMEQSVNPA